MPKAARKLGDLLQKRTASVFRGTGRDSLAHYSSSGTCRPFDNSIDIPFLWVCIQEPFRTVSNMSSVMLGSPRQTTSWSVGLLRGKSLDSLVAASGIANPIFCEHDVKHLGGTMAADPFAILVDGTWFLFFEMCVRDSPHAVIAAASSRDLLTWQPLGIVLDAGHHLSYPFVFEHGGGIFMMPESKKARAVTIYRAVKFPFRWEPVRTILRGKYFDASMVHHEGRWWLFAGWLSYSLRLFHANHPLGPWRPHAWPWIRTYAPSAARPGGRPVVIDGQLIRFAQDNVARYGHRLRAWRVTHLTPRWFAEEPWSPQPLLSPSGDGWNASGMHHIDPHRTANGEWIAFVDGHP